MKITFVINDHHSHVAAGFAFNPHRFAINDIFEANLTGNLGKNGDRIRVPLAQDSSLFDLLAFLHPQGCTGRNRIRFDFTTPIVDECDLTVSSQHNLLTRSALNRPHPGQANLTSLFRFDIRFNGLLTHATTDVERTHGQLGTWLTNALCSDDSNSHPFFNQRTGRHVHSVTSTTNTKRCITSHWCTNLNLLEAHRLDLTSDFRCDHFILRNDHLVRDGIHDRLPTDTTIDRINQTDLDLLTTVNHTLGNSLSGTTVVHCDHNVLCNVGQLTCQISTVRRLKSGISETFTSTVRRTEVLQHRQTFSEVRLNGGFDNLTGWLGHQPTHTSKLSNLLDTTPSTGV